MGAETYSLEKIMKKVIETSDESNVLHNVMIELNSICNWRCKHCYIENYLNKGIKYDKLLDVLCEMRKLRVYEITFTGGEIFCRRDVMDIIKEARKMGFEVVLFTNMSLLTKDVIKQLSALYVSLLSCTVFSMDPEIHDSITQNKGSFNKTIENVLLAKSFEIPIEVKTIVMKENYNSFLSVYDFCKQNEILFKPDIAIFSKVSGDKTNQSIMINDKQMNSIVKNIDAIVGYTPQVRNDEEYVCPSIRHSLSIDANGNVYPCNRILKSIGNIYDENLSNIWYNSKELQYIKNIRWGDLHDCQDCMKKSFCVRCAGAALLEDGDILTKSMLACKIAQAHCEVY